MKTIKVLRIAMVILAFLAALKLGDEFRRLLFQHDWFGAIDLGILQRWTKDWAAGKPIYGPVAPATYPPASFVILWPLVGWLDFNAARWLWAVTTVVVLTWFTWLIVRESGAATRGDRVLVALMLCSMNATGVTVGNGQLILHILPFLLTGVLWLRTSNGPKSDVAASLFILAALVKPTVTAPFLWLVIVFSRRIWPLVVVVAGYLALTLAAAHFQGTGLLAIVRAGLSRGVREATRGGYANLGFWLGNAGLEPWIIPAALLAFSALGLWISRHRNVDVWILLGVTAIVARLWTYHRVYDDVLLIFAEVALFRIARRTASRDGVTIAAGGLLGATIVAMLFLATWEHGPPPFDRIFAGGHTLVWLADLVFLLAYAERGRKRECASERAPALAS